MLGYERDTCLVCALALNNQCRRHSWHRIGQFNMQNMPWRQSIQTSTLSSNSIFTLFLNRSRDSPKKHGRFSISHIMFWWGIQKKSKVYCTQLSCTAFVVRSSYVALWRSWTNDTSILVWIMVCTEGLIDYFDGLNVRIILLSWTDLHCGRGRGADAWQAFPGEQGEQGQEEEGPRRHCGLRHLPNSETSKHPLTLRSLTFPPLQT